jgi:hypothetical protein
LTGEDNHSLFRGSSVLVLVWHPFDTPCGSEWLHGMNPGH